MPSPDVCTRSPPLPYGCTNSILERESTGCAAMAGGRAAKSPICVSKSLRRLPTSHMRWPSVIYEFVAYVCVGIESARLREAKS